MSWKEVNVSHSYGTGTRFAFAVWFIHILGHRWLCRRPRDHCKMPVSLIFSTMAPLLCIRSFHLAQSHRKICPSLSADHFHWSCQNRHGRAHRSRWSGIIDVFAGSRPCTALHFVAHVQHNRYIISNNQLYSLNESALMEFQEMGKWRVEGGKLTTVFCDLPESVTSAWKTTSPSRPAHAVMEVDEDVNFEEQPRKDSITMVTEKFPHRIVLFNAKSAYVDVLQVGAVHSPTSSFLTFSNGRKNAKSV